MGIYRYLVSKLNGNRRKIDILRHDTNQNEESSSEVIKIMNLLNYTNKNHVPYSALKYDGGYNSFEIDGYKFKGQRNPKMRLEGIPFSFDHSSVLDIGCNQGGILHELASKIKYGVGIDYNPQIINVANKIKSSCRLNNLDYFVFNLEKENLNYIKDFLPEKKVDVIFLLSICLWIRNWTQVIDFTSTISSKIIFESNGKEEEQLKQIDYIKKTYDNVRLIRKQSTDDPMQHKRQLYYCVNGEN